MADLSFNIATGQLSGTINNYSFAVRAWSGGRGGSKTPHVASEVMVNNPLLTCLKLDNSSHYAGPLPMAFYYLTANKEKQNWIKLTPFRGYMCKRDGFYIHGRGPIGSEGCIVPVDFSVVQKLYELVLTNTEAARSPYTLEVKAVGDINYFQKILKEYSRIA